MRLLKKTQWVCETILFFLISFLIAILPYKVSIRIGEIFGNIVFSVWKSRRNIAINNIKTVVDAGGLVISKKPELIVRDNFRNYFRNFIDIIKIFYGMGHSIIANLTIDGIEHFNEALSKGRGVIFITGHCGNWELLPIAFSQYSKINIVVRPLNNVYLNRILESFRKKYAHIIHKKGAAKGVLTALKKGGVVGLLIDQRVSHPEGILINFLGRKTYATKMHAVLAQKTRTPLLPAFIKRKGGIYTVEIGREIELIDAENDTAVLINTERCSRPIEEYIIQYPSEWLWIHRRWKHTPA